MYGTSYVYIRFDNPTASKDVYGNMTLNTNQTNDQLLFTAGPVNTALCIKGSTSFVIGSVSNDCLSSFAGCHAGYVFAFWLYVDEHKVDTTVEVLKFHDLSIEVDFKTVFSYNDTFHFKMLDCDDAKFDIGTKTYHHYIISVEANKASYQIFIDGELRGEYTCAPNLPGNQVQELVVGGSNKVCIDEFTVAPRKSGKIYQELYYESIVKGKEHFFGLFLC